MFDGRSVGRPNLVPYVDQGELRSGNPILLLCVVLLEMKYLIGGKGNVQEERMKTVMVAAHQDFRESGGHHCFGAPFLSLGDL